MFCTFIWIWNAFRLSQPPGDRFFDRLLYKAQITAYFSGSLSAVSWIQKRCRKLQFSDRQGASFGQKSDRRQQISTENK